jgi:hypothetical protein
VPEPATVLCVTALPASDPGAVPSPTSPREVRQALLPEEVGQFDSEWRRAMARSAETLDLTEVFETLARWRHIAELTRADPDAHRRMLRRAARIIVGEEQGTVSAEQLREIVGRRLGR